MCLRRKVWGKTPLWNFTALKLTYLFNIILQKKKKSFYSAQILKKHKPCLLASKNFNQIEEINYNTRQDEMNARGKGNIIWAYRGRGN